MNEPAMKQTVPNNALTAEELKLAQLIVSALNLEMQAAQIDPTAPLYGGGHGAGLDRHSGSRSCGLESLRRQAALRRRPQSQDLQFAAQSERAHSATSGSIKRQLPAGGCVMADI